MRKLLTGLVVTGALLALASCSDDDKAALTLVAYDSFPKDGTPLNEALAAFTDDTGIEVTVVNAGDTGSMVSKAVLTAGNPEGDVMWGVDNTFLSAAVDGEVFEGEPTQVNFGDVCLNYDIAWFDEQGLEPPATLDDLIDPAYADLLVVENPVTSSPGLAFLLATIAEYGDPGWDTYWAALRDNGVEVVDSWESAYYERFSGSAGSTGDRPLVVSYASSPPAEVLFADPPVDTAPTGVVEATCFRQTEYAGVLAGTDHPDEATQLVEFLTGTTFQQELPLTLFVYPVNDEVALPEVFTQWSVVAADPYTMDPATIAEQRQDWQEQWTSIVTG
jgi:thiamine transport system substrate-binding protein